MTTQTQNLPAPITSRPPSVFSAESAFEAAQRMAKALCASTLVPKEYQGNSGLPNAMIALEMAQRVGASPLAVMQNMHVIHGRPSWSSTFIIASLNSCGRFSPLRFELAGTGENQTCFAWAYDSTGEKLTGPASSIEMAKAEGWYQKNGSKWKTMPELMLRYRAAAFFGRLYAPDILMGMHADDEVRDIGQQATVTDAPVLVTEVDEVETLEVETVTETPAVATKPAEPELDREELKARLDELDVEYSSKARTATLQKLFEDAEAERARALETVSETQPDNQPPPLADVDEPVSDEPQQAVQQPPNKPIQLF